MPMYDNDLHGIDEVSDSNLIPSLYPVIRRLPPAFDPALRFLQAERRRLPYGEPSAILAGTQFSRPEGSFAARSFGNVIHACIEMLTARIAGGATPSSLGAELPSWSARIAALLRADGLPAATVSGLAREAGTALGNLLQDPVGQWLLAPHPGAAAEFSVTAASGDGLSTVRVDRVFRAGGEPGSRGETCLWIVDYKTASRSAAATVDFLETQRAAYAEQLEIYARVLAPAQSVAPEEVRLALYFPALGAAQRLIWWPLQTGATQETAIAAQSELRTEN